MYFRSLMYLATTLAAMARPISAQIDYRNVDDHRPTLTEDAYPIERYAWEVMFPYHFERGTDGGNSHVMLVELTHAPFRNFHIGIKSPLTIIDPSHGESTGPALSGVKVYGLYNFFTEGPWLPAVSVRADLSLPWGSLGGDATRTTLKAIATKSWGLTRVHLNIARSFGESDQVRAVAEPAADWWLSAAIDRTFFRQSVLLIGEVYARRVTASERVEVTATVGTRYQWTPTIVLDVGLSRRLRADTGPGVGINVGLSYAFALRGLMPRGPS